MVQKVYSSFKHPKLYLAIKVWVLSNQIIKVISCKEGSKAISPHIKPTFTNCAFLSDFISPETFLRFKKQDYVVTEPLLYSFITKYIQHIPPPKKKKISGPMRSIEKNAPHGANRQKTSRHTDMATLWMPSGANLMKMLLKQRASIAFRN